MVFFTRELYLGVQPQSGWERRAEREWDRRAKIYDRYAEVIAPLLPVSVRRLCKHGLHDGVVRQASIKGGELVLELDLTNALSGFRGRQIRLTFRGVRGRPAVSKLVGQWWLYEEGHLSSRARFNLQVLFDPSELEVEADELVIEPLPRSLTLHAVQSSPSENRAIRPAGNVDGCCTMASSGLRVWPTRSRHADPDGTPVQGTHMRLVTAFTLLLLLAVACPVFAQGDPLDSDHQTNEYGRIFGYVCAVSGVLVVLIAGMHIVRGMIAESARGKKPGYMPEVVLDNAPKPKQKETLYLGEKVPDWKIANREAATTAALKFMSRKDQWFDRKEIAMVADKAFRSVKASLEERSAKKIEHLVTADCLEELRTEIKRLRKKGERHVFGKLDITEIQVVHIEAPAGKGNHTFTAMLSAKSKDYFQDDESGEVLRGDKKTYVYQEFWRFRRSKERWLVERIRSSGDMDRVLNAKNVMTQVDLDAFAKVADPEHLREFVIR